MDILPEKPSVVSALQKLFFVFLSLILIILAVTVLTYFIEPTDSPQNVFISNISDHQATISWTTKKPTRGQAAVSLKNNLPFIPVFVKTHKDDGEKSLKQQNFYTTHHITINNLQPSTSYYFKIYQGLRGVYSGQLQTSPTLDFLPAPNPVYGKVVKGDGKTAVVGAMVYFWATTPDGQKSTLLSTLTSLDGGWSVDLANLRSQDLTKTFPYGKGVTEEIVVERGTRGKVKTQTVPGKDKPWGNVILNF